MEQSSVSDNQQPVLMFFGDSITDGYMLERTDAFPYLIEQKLRQLGYDFRVINEGVSGDETGDGLDRADEALRVKPDIFMLELGANDGLRELDLEICKANLQKIINKVKDRNPDVILILAGMEMPLEMPENYRIRFRSLYKELVKDNKTYFIPFILEGVGGVPELNFEDGIHPTADGHVVIADHVWSFLRPIIEKFKP
ncbi:arylesterase [Marinoscillum sp. MHG1-6]|uniref:arylesterase n=1 Tax=Marinoscillum sp. MHG1-6 TaxID=2959627 RepID=UPI0021570CB6|nr:arylesterase [Marinoscillum sp. MHG1-6]